LREILILKLLQTLRQNYPQLGHQDTFQTAGSERTSAKHRLQVKHLLKAASSLLLMEEEDKECQILKVKILLNVYREL